MKNSEILIAARALIAKEENWCQGVIAKDSHDSEVPYDSAEAIRFCMLGATKRVSNDYTNFLQLYEIITDQTRSIVSNYNDTHTHAEVIALFDKAITEAQRQEQAQICKDCHGHAVSYCNTCGNTCGIAKG